MDAQTRDLDESILAFIRSREPSDAAFNALALAVFAYQYERNEPYRRHCERSARMPGSVHHWAEIPAVSTTSFGDTRLATFRPDETVLRFVSSGTTSGGDRRSVHELDTAALYEASLLAHFRRMILPDRERMRIVALVPPFAQAPSSSLAYMVETLIREMGAPRSDSFIDGDDLRFDALCRALSTADEPLLVFGTAFAFVHWFDRLKAERIKFELAPDSRVVETGGFKGRSRSIGRDELYASFDELLGVPRDRCASEYGMCELGSQWYDTTIADRATGAPPRLEVKRGPHWARATIVDPVTARPVEHGGQGLVQIFDLSNRGSVSALLTGDLGRMSDDGEGFVLSGRHPGAPPKGCSIDADALLGSRDG